MRMRLVAMLLLSMSTPVCAQTVATTSGAMSMVDITDPPAASGGDPTTHLITPPTVVAPGLAAAGVETCLGSDSGGISLMGGGFSFGGTKVDPGCTIRLLARELFAFGFRKAALALMCQDERVFVAMGEAGTPCPAAPVEFAQGDPIASLPTPPVQNMQVTTFSKDEAALFARESAVD